MGISSTGIIAALGVVGVLASPLAAEAQTYGRYGYGGYDDGCSHRVHDRGATGAILGGLAGAVIGSNLAAHHGGRTGGAALGAAAGAAIGSNMARSSAKRACSGEGYNAHYGYGDYSSDRYDPDAGTAAYGDYSPYSRYSRYGGYDGYGDSYPPPHDRGLHRGWYKHHHHDEDDDGD